MLEEEGQLLAALHEGMFEENMWSTFLSMLRRRIGADYISLIFRRRDTPINQIVELFDGKTAPTRLYRNYLDEIYKRDPVPYHELTPGRVYGLFELLDRSVPDHAAYIDEFLAPSGANYVRILRVVEPSGYSGWLTMCRTDSEFSAGALASVKALVPHMSIALRCFAAIDQSRVQQTILSDAVGRMNFGCITLDSDGQIIDRDANAQRIMEVSEALGQDGRGHLLLTDRAIAQRLKASLAEFATNSGAKARVFHLSDEPALDLLLMPVACRPLSGRKTPVVVAYIHSDRDDGVDRSERLVEMFGLSKTEAKLGVALSRGRTIAEAAVEIGITLETARNYSKRIFSKTGTRRQAELVRLILSSEFSLA